MPLTDVAVKNAKPSPDGKPRKLADEKGLYLLVKEAGKYWRMDYRFDGKRKTLAIGVYPDVPLRGSYLNTASKADWINGARDLCEQARALLASGVDPMEHKKAKKASRTEANANSFEVIGREWFAKMKPDWAASHADKILARLERDVFPWLGKKPVSEITAPDVLAVLRRIEGRGTNDTAHRASGNCSQIFRYAIATGRAERDPVPDLRGALPALRHKNFASITEPDKVAELLRAMDAFTGTFVVKSALLLSPLLFVRPGELRKAKWSDFDLDKGEWSYFVTKTKTDHLVPLSTQAVTLLCELHALTGSGQHVFSGRDPKKCMSEAAVNAALRRMGYDTKTEITGHGFRAMARTILHEELHQKPEVIEHQLAHTVQDPNGTAYNRTKFLKARREMMQTWADYLDKLKAGAEVIQLRGNAA